MPLKIISDENAIVLGTSIPRATIVQMVQNFIDRTFKGPRKISRDVDSHAVHYTKKEIDELFKANGYDPTKPDSVDFGLRIYLAVHSNTPAERTSMPNRPARYLDQHTVVLVTTIKKIDQLVEGKFVSTYQMDPGSGMEEGEICPPPTCGTMDAELFP